MCECTLWLLSSECCHVFPHEFGKQLPASTLLLREAAPQSAVWLDIPSRLHTRPTLSVHCATANRAHASVDLRTPHCSVAIRSLHSDTAVATLLDVLVAKSTNWPMKRFGSRGHLWRASPLQTHAGTKRIRLSEQQDHATFSDRHERKY